MNDEKKAHPNPNPPSDPTVGSDADDNPWDEDDGGGRTLATDGPSFEMPSNIPSPITVPPPAMDPPKMPGTMPLIGFTPPAPALSPVPGATKPFPVAPLGGSTLQASPAPPSSPDLSADALAAAAAAGGAPSVKRAPPQTPPRPMGGPPAATRPGAGAPPPSARMPVAPGQSARMPVAPAAPPAPAAPVAPSPDPVADDDQWANASEQDDGPTMAVASPALAGRPVRDDVVNPRSSPLASTGYVPGGAEAFEAARARARNADKDAETMAGDSPLLGLGGMYATDSEETTRAVSREELMRHQDAHVIVGRDAVGDDATLALAPGMLDEALGASTEQGGTGGIGAALAEVLQPPVPPVPPHPGPPAFPPPPQFQQPPPWGAPQAFDAAFDPMLPQGRGGPPMGGGGYPSSGQQQVYGGPNPQQATAPGPPSQGQFAMQQGQQGMQAMQPMQPQPGQQPMWMPQPSGPPAGVGGLSRFTPQVILLVAVGAVCLAIFIIGIVLFVTTKF